MIFIVWFCYVYLDDVFYFSSVFVFSIFRCFRVFCVLGIDRLFRCLFSCFFIFFKIRLYVLVVWNGFRWVWLFYDLDY